MHNQNLYHLETSCPEKSLNYLSNEENNDDSIKPAGKFSNVLVVQI